MSNTNYRMKRLHRRATVHETIKAQSMYYVDVEGPYYFGLIQRFYAPFSPFNKQHN